MSLIKKHIYDVENLYDSFEFGLPRDDLDFILSLLDEEPQGGRADALHSELLRQMYE